ncbi:selenocysteine-specific translation elongation factor [Ideonella sp.]|jgi:selenocysteine-specific elongation factor|uniref:selenocysteine-specific translation elongation factor n=1 Tax=Ideonella sp. TaxID=1929293 RepID=UPI0037C06D0F
MIIGTAGHIDHGKTTLVQALTGVNTDRLPEEQRRGISIELGYAFLEVPDGPRIGFVDVPGHERLVHTMLAGATGMDYVLLLVAADDGVMPQTREHVAALCLLGLSQGAVVITKCDRATPERVSAVRAEVAALLAPTALAALPVWEVSAHTGQGLSALKDELLSQAQVHQARVDSRTVGGQGFRLAVDRAFSLEGVGTVLTGTAHAGAVKLGDSLALVPQAHVPCGVLSAPPAWRVRSLHAQNRKVEQATSGQRCAVALVGLAREQAQRGQWLVHPEAALQTDRLDVSLQLWHEEARALRSGTPVHVHLGATEVMGTVAVLAHLPAEDEAASAWQAADQLKPGARAAVQLVLREPVGAWVGDRVVLRDAAASRVLAGGQVLDALAPARYRRTPERLAQLQAMHLALPEGLEGRLARLLPLSPLGLDLTRERAMCGAALARLPQGAVEVREGHSAWALAAPLAQEIRAKLLAQLAAHHQAQPEELGPDVARLRRLTAPRLPDGLWRALVTQAAADGEVLLRGAFVHLPEHGVHLSATEQRIAQKMAPLLAVAGFGGVWVRDVAKDMQESEPLTRTTLSRLAQQGELHQVVKDLIYDLPTLERLGGLVRAVAAQSGGEVTAAAFRDVTDLGRKRAIQILEYFDRIGLLRRVGDVHKLRPDCSLFMSPQTAASDLPQRAG